MTDRGSAPPEERLPGFVAAAPASRRLVELASRAAPVAASVLLTGESGVGKSHLARAMHELARPGEPFVIIDCGNLPEGLAENELFGHEEGAYSGATRRQPGRFEAAGEGTALLDRVSDLPVEVQGKLLRVLQERSFERVGGHATVRMRAQVVATAGEGFGDLVRSGAFRADLFYRLNVVHLAVPPLRERLEDVAALAVLFLERLAARLGRPLTLAAGALDLLDRHAWPGNVRELQNVLERAATFGERTELAADDLAPGLEPPRRSPERAIAALAEAGLSLAELEGLYVQAVLARTARLGDAARTLGIHRKTLLDKRKRHGLD